MGESLFYKITLQNINLLAKNSFQASFLPTDAKDRLIAELDDYCNDSRIFENLGCAP